MSYSRIAKYDQHIQKSTFWPFPCYIGNYMHAYVPCIQEVLCCVLPCKGARILAVCSELISIFLRGPSEDHIDSLVGQSLFGDGAAAMIIESDPIEHAEKPVFQLLSASQTLIPDSERAMGVHMREEGLTFDLSRGVPSLISRNIESILVNVLGPIGIKDWNSIFWVAHPGGRVILDRIESKLGLEKTKLNASRHVLRVWKSNKCLCGVHIG
ncbi:hypothetical protein Droror1_Dr00022648 [Drosera rotundifolia]